MTERRREALFRFDPITHTYLDLEGRTIPHITGMLKAGGWVDDTWFTEESSIRGEAVHGLTAAFDLDALDPTKVISSYRSWLLAWVEAVKRLRPEWDAVEEPWVHPVHRFGGRPDNLGRIARRRSAVEKKTRTEGKGDLRPVGIQLALQCILASSRYGLPPEHWMRYAVFLFENGSFSIEPFTNRRDFDEAYRLIKKCCGGNSGTMRAVASASTRIEAAASEGSGGLGSTGAAIRGRGGRSDDGAAPVAVPPARRAARARARVTA